MTTHTETTNEKWPIKMSDNLYTQIVLKAGRYKSKLVRIKPIRTTVYLQPDQMEDRLLFIFEPIDIKLKEGESAGISISVRPSNSEKSKMYKLLCGMSEAGTIPEHIRQNETAYQKFAEDLIGKVFSVSCQPSKNGKYNNATVVTWIDQPKEAPPEPEKEKEASDSGFENMPDLIEGPTTTYGYNLKPLKDDKQKLAKAQNLLKTKGAKELFPNQWESPVEIPNLKNYASDDNEIPF